MGMYGKYLLPRLIELAMSNKAARRERVRLVPRASGVVLEIGVGSGLNIPIYGGAVQKLYALDPSPELLRMARSRRRNRASPSSSFSNPPRSSRWRTSRSIPR